MQREENNRGNCLKSETKFSRESYRAHSMPNQKGDIDNLTEHPTATLLFPTEQNLKH